MSCVGQVYIDGEGLRILLQSPQIGPCDHRDRCKRYNLLRRAMNDPELTGEEASVAMKKYQNCEILRGTDCPERTRLGEKK